ACSSSGFSAVSHTSSTPFSMAVAVRRPMIAAAIPLPRNAARVATAATSVTAACGTGNSPEPTGGATVGGSGHSHATPGPYHGVTRRDLRGRWGGGGFAVGVGGDDHGAAVVVVGYGVPDLHPGGWLHVTVLT